MIIVKDTAYYDRGLKTILSTAAEYIQEQSLKNPELLKLSGTLFEKTVCDTLNFVSKNTDFEDKFEQSSAHAFPDIYTRILNNEWFGIEVKTSQKDWKCFGNSIFESVKVNHLEDRIYVFFGKFSSKTLECRWAKYDSCVDNINITHSPRYQINMDIVDNPSYSVFAKMNTTYLDFSGADTSKRMDYVRKFKRQGLGQDVALWWLPDNEEPSEDEEKKLIIKLLSELPPIEREMIVIEAMAYFPEVFSNDTKSKYSRILTWLASHHGVVTGNIRDYFTAGGKWDVSFNDTVFRLPQICRHLFLGAEYIKNYINEASQDDLTYRWALNGLIFKTDREKIEYWIIIVSANLSRLPTIPRDFPTTTWLNSVFEL